MQNWLYWSINWGKGASTVQNAAGGPIDTIYTDYTDFIRLLIDFLKISTVLII